MHVGVLVGGGLNGIILPYSLLCYTIDVIQQRHTNC